MNQIEAVIAFSKGLKQITSRVPLKELPASFAYTASSIGSEGLKDYTLTQNASPPKFVLAGVGIGLKVAGEILKEKLDSEGFVKAPEVQDIVNKLASLPLEDWPAELNKGADIAAMFGQLPNDNSYDMNTTTASQLRMFAAAIEAYVAKQGSVKVEA